MDFTYRVLLVTYILSIIGAVDANIKQFSPNDIDPSKLKNYTFFKMFLSAGDRSFRFLVVFLIYCLVGKTAKKKKV